MRLKELIFIIFVMSGLYAGCDSIDDTYSDFIKGGEIIYIGTADSVEVFSGYYRIKLQWQLTTDPKITKCRVFWNFGADSVEVPVERTTKIDTVKVIIDGLSESVHTFGIRTYDNEGHQSIEVSKVGAVYGDNYLGSLTNRPVESISENNEDVVIKWYGAASTVIGMELRYININGENTSVIADADESTTTLPGAGRYNTSIDYRTLILPEAAAIDTFYTAWYTVEFKSSLSYSEDDPTTYGYTLMSSMTPSSSLIGGTWSDVNTFMKTLGWEYTEHPNNATGDHNAEEHIGVTYDAGLGMNVFNFMVHNNSTALDGDRGTSVGGDRQRNEMKSRTGTSYYPYNGNWDEWQVLEWKMKIPAGFRPSTSFTHIHQLKGQEGTNISSPVVTLTVRGNNDGTNRRLQVIHNGDASSSSKGTIVDNIAIEDFEDEWVQVQTETHFVTDGYYRIKITRLSDGKVLMYHTDENIDMWRTGGAVNIRNKHGIYRSFGSTMAETASRPANGIKDENLWLTDFRVYEKNTNTDPQPYG